MADVKRLPTVPRTSLPRVSSVFDHQRIDSDRQCFRPGRGLTESERSAFHAVREVVIAELRPAAPEEIVALIFTPLMATRVLGGNQADTPALLGAQYRAALEDMPPMALEEAHRAIRDGELPPITLPNGERLFIHPRFFPTPAEMRLVAKHFADRMRFEVRWIDRVLTLPEAAPDAPPEDPAVIAARLDRIGAVLKSTFRASPPLPVAVRSRFRHEEPGQAEREERERRDARIKADMATRPGLSALADLVRNAGDTKARADALALDAVARREGLTDGTGRETATPEPPAGDDQSGRAEPPL